MASAQIQYDELLEKIIQKYFLPIQEADILIGMLLNQQSSFDYLLQPQNAVAERVSLALFEVEKRHVEYFKHRAPEEQNGEHERLFNMYELHVSPPLVKLNYNVQLPEHLKAECEIVFQDIFKDMM